MPDPYASVPAGAERRTALQKPHPLYTEHADAWEIFLDALEGSGGFLTGDYLWRYPRENSGDFAQRQKQARYHNYVKTLINIYVRYVFRGGVTRTTDDEELMKWWADVDGAGTKILDFMKRTTRIALALSNCGILIDKERADVAKVAVKADDKAKILALVFSPLAILDWRTHRNGTTPTFVKLRETVPTPDVSVQTEDKDSEEHEECNYLIWDMEDWVRYDDEGDKLDGAVHGLGFVPLVMMRPEPSSQYPFLGQPLLGNHNVVRALFNRCSEEDEVLRNSSFSMLGVSVGDNAPDSAVADAKRDLGSEVGTTRAIIVRGQIDYKTPDQSVPGAIRANVQFLIQEIYRMAHIAYSVRESQQAETAEAIRLKHAELEEMLVGIVEENERVEREMARNYFHWREPNAAAADNAFEAAKVKVEYTRQFFIPDMVAELDKWAKALAMDLGKTMRTTIKKQAARSLSPGLDEETLKTIDKEIDSQPDQAAVAPFPVARDRLRIAAPRPGEVGTMPQRGPGAASGAA